MKYRSATAALIVTTSLLLTGAGATVAVADVTANKVHATLTGGPDGDPDGKGKFSATIREHSLCYMLTATNVGATTGGHIHADDGSIVVTLRRTGKHEICLFAVPDAEDTELTISESELDAIAADPSGYYVDLHSVRYPDGAISGPLK
jgi:hypothetical protein